MRDAISYWSAVLDDCIAFGAGAAFRRTVELALLNALAMGEQS
jgi:hypothetical protein